MTTGDHFRARANMVIFHEPDRLEFAGGGKSLGVFREELAGVFFNTIKSAAQRYRPILIQDAFEFCQGRAE